MNQDNKMGFWSLMGLIITTIIGSGIFNLSKEMATVASQAGVMIGWLITGVGMGCLALAMQEVSRRRPDLESGIFNYARAGFGEYIGFNSAWGYWISSLIKNAAYGTLIFSALSYFFPYFEDGQNLYSFIGASLLLWLIHGLISQGVRQAELVNAIILLAKLAPIIIFLILALTAFRFDLFQVDFWGQLHQNIQLGSLSQQVKETMLVSVFSFIGLESAVAFSGKAQDQRQVGTATVLAFCSVTLIYAAVTILSFGILSREEIVQLPNPSLAYLMEALIGRPGAIFVNIGVIFSIFGAWFSSTLLNEEVVYQAAHLGLFPAYFDQRNQRLISMRSLTVSNGLIQLLFLSFLLIPNAYSNLTKLSSASILFSYTCMALYLVKLNAKQTKASGQTKTSSLIAWVASIYMIWLIYASGRTYLILSLLLLFPGSLLYMGLQWQQGRKVFKTYEWIIFIILTFGFCYSLAQLI
ncbi:basic amino acid/polyamine antiporter [Ignavigranum ruoffiae]|uniref:basic amino acid/polyamine antiporter n=1 Tax=Ignavigranum ruoffiae TaxID=89093 RepID=UPI0020614C0C|nr:basic amino acid/polyamine antiporter [Ignavigranum ruoffiae]UPQ86151.1 basic amino acid/polyamine antiporter [Ignavigranum ruoffiae]